MRTALVTALIAIALSSIAPARAQDVTLPEPLTEASPRYPEEALAAGLEADVILFLTIDVDGRVTAAEIVEGAGHGFDEAALAEAPRLRFSPARDAEDQPFASRIRYQMRFRIEEREVVVQTSTLRGRVRLAEIDAPLAGASVRIEPSEGEAIAVTSGVDGTFEVELAPGSYHVTISAPGHQTLTLREDLAPGTVTEVSYPLAVDVAGAIDVVAAAERPPREVTRRTLEQREIARIPGTGGDARKSIQSLPGVARTQFFNGALIVRGSAPFDSQTFIDGIYVPLIYHFGGLSSVVPTELLERIDFYPGNFSARYGRALGGIVEARLRSPRSDGYHGFAQLDLIDARLMVEGPVPLVEGWSFIAAARRSHLDAWLGPVLEEAGAGVTQAPVYYDYQLMAEHESGVRLAFFGSDDALEILVREPSPGEPALSGNIGLRTSFQRFEASHRLSRGKHRFDALTSLGHEQIRVAFGPLFIDLEGYSLFSRIEHSYFASDAFKLHAGVDVLASHVTVSQQLPAASRPGEVDNQPFSTRNVLAASQQIPVVQPAGYLELEVKPFERWRIVPGVRLDYTRAVDRFELSPRINSRVDVVQGFPRTTLKGGIGVFTQPPQPQQSTPPIGTRGIGNERAIHHGLGVEQEITEQIEISVEGFYKQLDDIVTAAPSGSGVASRFTNDGSGRAYGAEILARYKPDEHFFGWLAYTLSRTERQTHPGAEVVLVPWDQTHILTVLGSYRFGDGWELGARFRFVSGNLEDPNVCNPAQAACDENRVNALFHAASGAYTPIRFGGDNSERLPPFHQLDVRLDKAFVFDPVTLRLYLDVQNVYNHTSPEGISYDYRFSARQYVAGLPILPSLGIRGEL